LPKLTLQVKIQLTLLFVLAALFVTAQNNADITIHHKDAKVYVEVLVQIQEIEHIVSSEDFCEQGTSLSFCFRNYIQEKLKISINGTENLEFIIEASLANAEKMQLNLSAVSTQTSFSSFEIENNAFVEEIEGFTNNMTVKLNEKESKQALDLSKRSLSVN